MAGNTGSELAATGATVLVVDREAGASAVLEELPGVQVEAVEGSAAALERLRAGEVTCVVSAYALPDGDGVTLLKRVREEFADLPFVLYVRDGSEAVASDAIAAGVTDYVRADDGAARLIEGVEGAVAGNGSTAGGGPDGAAGDGSTGEAGDGTPASAAVVHSSPAGTFALEDGKFVDVSDRFAAMLGYAPGELSGMDAISLVASEDRERVAAVLEDPMTGGDPVLDGEARRYTFTCVRKGGDRIDLECHAWRPGGAETVVGAALDVTEREAGERQLAALRQAMRGMMKTKDKERIGELAVETVVEVMDPLVATVSLYDAGAGGLRRVASASGMMDLFDRAPSLSGDEGIAWDAFVRGEHTVVDDVPAHEGTDPDTPVRSEMVVPLGDHGVLAVGAAMRNAYGETDLRFVRTLATVTEMALDRADREETILERTEQLREQNEQLDRLRRIDEIVRDIGGMLVRATDRESIERGVCERLAAVNHWQFVWIGEQPVTESGITPRAHAGAPEGYLDAVAAAADGDAFAGTPTELALESGDPQTRENLVATNAPDEWRTTALDHGFRSVTSIPLQYEHRNYGVLEVYGDNPSMFGDAEQDVLRELADMIAYAINAVEREQALFADAGPEIEMHVPGTSAEDCFQQLAAAVEAEVTVDGIVRQSDGSYLAYLSIPDTDLAAVESFVDRSPVIDRVRGIGPEDSPRFEVRLSGNEMFETVASHGATIRGLSATAAGATLRIELPVTASIRRFVNAFTSVYPDAEVTAQRSTFEADDGRDVGARFTDMLTDRQREVIQIAYHSGFFEWPRESTGEEIADSLNVSPPTVHKHIRAAERKLLTAILGSRRD